MTESERLWREAAERNGWHLGPPAAWPLRLWGIRHVRHAWLAWQVHRCANEYGSVGIGLGCPNQRDLWVLYAIYRGWC